MFDYKKKAEYLKRGSCKRYEYKTEKRYKRNGNVAPKLVHKDQKYTPIPYDLLQEIYKLYNGYWKFDKLYCAKWEDVPIAIRTKSLLDDSYVYSISNKFFAVEYPRTKSKTLRRIMRTLLVFDDIIEKVDKEIEKHLEALVYRDKYIKTKVTYCGDVEDEAYEYI